MTIFNPAAEHRCARCGQWWWKTHTCPDLGGRAIPPPSGPFEVTTTDKLTAERDALRAEAERLRADARRVPDAIERLADLVAALDGAFISSWQSTAHWQSQLDSAREFLVAINAARAAQGDKT